MTDKILKIKKSTLVDIADQVRAKTGSTDKIKVSDLDDAVANISGGGAIDPMKLSSYNNPNLGFYYGQTFTIDDPITIDMSKLISALMTLEMSELTLFNDDDGFEIKVPLYKGNDGFTSTNMMIYIYNKPSDGTYGIQIKSGNQYVSFEDTCWEELTADDVVTFTLRDVYNNLININNSYFENVPDYSRWPVLYGYVNVNAPSILINLNDPDVIDVYGCIKIGK